jgi:hypothetical protein
MANTFIPIQTVTVGSGGSSSIDFTSIPNTYTDLCLKFSLRDSRSSQGPGYLNLKFNDSTTGYSMRILFTSTDDGSVVNGSNATDYLTYAINTNFSTANTFGNGELYISNYAGSTYKSVSVDAVSETNHAYNAAVRGLTAFLWSNTAAITKITLYGGSMPFLQHSTATLYGIKST